MRDVKVPIIHLLLRKIIIFFAYNLDVNKDSNSFYDYERIVRSHSLWRFFDSSRMDNALQTNMNYFGFDYYNFSGGTDKPKYAPVIWSLPNAETGKPLSLEIRIIPNSFLMGGKLQISLIKEIEVLLNNRILRTSEEYKKLLFEIKEMHFALCSTLIRKDTGILKEYIEVRKDLFNI